MKSVVGQMLERGMLVMVPRVEREYLIGDLNEEFGQAVSLRRLAVLASVVLRCNVEPYRNGDQALRVLVLLMVGLGLLWVVPLASANMFASVDMLSNTLIRAAALLWGASHVTGAIATGLLVGRTAVDFDTGVPVRLHIGLLLSGAIALFSPSPGAAAVSISLLIATIVVGDQARKLSRP